MSPSVIILAAGKGTRMKSNKPKVLQSLAGKPLLQHVIDTAKSLESKQLITVYGHGGAQVQQQFANEHITWVEQLEQLGTGHAVQVCLDAIAKQGQSLILYGDVPLVQKSTLEQLVAAAQHSGIAMISLVLDNPTGYGRVVRKNGEIQRIIEQKDATEMERQITEVNTGIYCVSNEKLHQWLPQLSNDNAQGEYYLTDIIEMAVNDGLSVGSIQPAQAFEVEGVNDRRQLYNLERCWQKFQAEQLMTQGVSFADAARFDLRGKLEVGKDVFIDINVIIEGDCYLADHVYVGAGSIIKHSRIGANTVIQPYTLFDHAIVGDDVQIGPFSRLRPGAKLANEVHIGNFVEVKNTTVGFGSKANHFTYLGDAKIGEKSNIGAGTITCNYDGANKHQTTIGDQVFIGSNSSLVAPLTIGNQATIGAGSVITHNVAEHALSFERSKQLTKNNYQRPQKAK